MAFRKLNENEIKRLQDHLFELLCEFDDFCQKYNIDYQLNGGNVLGAVRHQNFIPWDDDLDIMLTQKELDKFLSLSHLFPKHWQWLDDTSGIFPVKKLLSQNYLVYTKNLKHEIIHSPIWIDFFVLEECSHEWYQATNLIDLIRFRKNYPSWHFKHFLPRLFKYPIHFIAKTIKNTKSHNSKTFLRYQQHSMFPAVFQYNDIFPTQKYLTLRNRIFPGPNNLNTYLLSEYGHTYMQIPPKDKQAWHVYQKL